MLSPAWVIAVALTLQNPPPVAPAPATWPDDQPLSHFAQNLGHDLAALPSLSNGAILAAGFAGVGLVHAKDEPASAWAQRQGPNLSYSPIGGLIGNAWMQGGAAIATYIIGKKQHSAELAHIGSDLVRAQVLNGVLTTSLKIAVDRTRPNGAGRAFPSGHSSATFASATVLQGHYGWKVGVPAYAFASFIGWTRVRDNQHWVSDVVFGTAVGIISGATVTRGHRHSAWTVTPVITKGGAGVYFIKR